ncbi:hypothetical protein [Pseudochrobactrum saccharolyticum]|uniref:hypothetical protein n=1 Tax=Pseudochrobactrum saccharolyticum TaxID=354352 RepID=UPI002744FC74|nr:hypothetical protein [Pseudochrobactrum saccharolyticum]MDP8251356.1 hypothetical protein [Pseudochrobactrum saccharolyticum]
MNITPKNTSCLFDDNQSDRAGKCNNLNNFQAQSCRHFSRESQTKISRAGMGFFTQKPAWDAGFMQRRRGAVL